jgi:hypothetical protein
MKTSSTLGLGVVAAALVAGGLFYSRHEETVISEAQAPVKTVTSGITSNTVERIDIAVPGETSVTLTRQNDTWYTDAAKKHRADKSAVNAIFAALEKEISGEVVSSDPDSYPDYQVNETSGTRVKLYEAGKQEPVQDLLIGKDGGAAFTTYVRDAHGKDVINARAQLSYTFKRPEGWRDKQILEFPQDAVTKVAAEGTSSTFEVAKNEAGTWKVVKPALGDAQPTKVNPIVSMASTLRANEFVETSQPLSELGLSPPRQKLTITFDDKSTSPPKSTTSILLIGDKKSEGQYYAKRPDSDDVYTIGEYMATTFAPEPATLALTPPPSPANEATTGTASSVSQTSSTAETSAPAVTSETITSGTESATAQPATSGAVETSSSAASVTPAPASTPAPTPAVTPASTPVAAPAATPTATPPPPAVATPSETTSSSVTVSQDTATSPTQ